MTSLLARDQAADPSRPGRRRPSTPDPERRRPISRTAVLATLPAVAFVIATTGLFYALVGDRVGFANPFVLTAAFVVGTDGLMLGLTIWRRHDQATPPSVNTDDVTIVISCFRSADVIRDTIERALEHAPAEQIIVVSDASPDDTAEIARSYGVQVVENRLNRNKPLSINRVCRQIRTRFTLILDDDTLISREPLPVGLLEAGYSAVTFNVMPVRTGSVVNGLQRFEYRKSMLLGRAVRSRVGAISNVSGAIGLFWTRDLREQCRYHSGVFSGEDLQRTILTHLLSSGKGVAFAPQTVDTEAPDDWRSLFRQRSRAWSMATQETFFLSWRVLFSPRVHHLVKFERAYSLFVLTTDPLRMLAFPLFIIQPIAFLVLYAVYLPLEFAAWLRTGRKDPVWAVLLSPAFSLLRNLARFYAHFYWFQSKWEYLVRKRFHRLIPARNLLAEYAAVTLVLLVFWAWSLATLVG